MQLQQALMNLVLNGIDAMHDVDGPREQSSSRSCRKTNCGCSQRHGRGTAPAPGRPDL